MKKITIIIATAVATLVCILVFLIAWKGFLSPHSFYQESRAYDLYAKALQEQLQFTHGSPYYEVGDEITEVFTLNPNSDSSPLAKAGVASGDIVYDDFTIAGFYMLLEQYRGKVFRFRVVQGGDGPQLRERSQRIIEIHVPRRINK
jgi:hypothetical protein